MVEAQPVSAMKSVLAGAAKKFQGKVVAQADGGNHWLVSFPDGTVRGITGKRAVEKAAKDWFAKDIAGAVVVGVGIVEWRT